MEKENLVDELTGDAALKLRKYYRSKKILFVIELIVFALGGVIIFSRDWFDAQRIPFLQAILWFIWLIVILTVSTVNRIRSRVDKQIAALEKRIALREDK